MIRAACDCLSFLSSPSFPQTHLMDGCPLLFLSLSLWWKLRRRVRVEFFNRCFYGCDHYYYYYSTLISVAQFLFPGRLMIWAVVVLILLLLRQQLPYKNDWRNRRRRRSFQKSLAPGLLCLILIHLILLLTVDQESRVIWKDHHLQHWGSWRESRLSWWQENAV